MSWLRERRPGKLKGNGDRVIKPIFTNSDTNCNCLITKRTELVGNLMQIFYRAI